MAMSKKDFIGLADALCQSGATIDVQEEVARFCAASNPRFMRERWIGYIRGENGKNGGKIKTQNGNGGGKSNGLPNRQ